jgi:hypothetical protein
MRFTRLAISVVAVAALAVPAAASAHPSVYTDETLKVPTPAPSPITHADLIVDQTRYVVSNHGNSYVLRESNSQMNPPKGVIDYKILPSAYRNQPSVPTDVLIAAGGTDAQAHHTCKTAALDDVGAIEAWQERSAAGKSEPFFGYVPFQEASAGLDDHPELWIPLVLSETGVDLTQVSDVPAGPYNPDLASHTEAATQLKSLCESAPPAGLGGTFVLADRMQTLATAFNSATISAATAPLNAQITQLNTFTQMLETQKAAAQKAAADAQSALTGAQADVARLNTRLRLEPVGNQSPARLAANGPSVNVSGPAGMTVKVRLRVTRAARKALDWDSLVLGKQTATIEQDGTVLVEIPLGRKANVALRKAKANGVYFAARSGDRWTSTRNRGR